VTTSPSLHNSIEPSESNTHLPSLYPSFTRPTDTNTTSPSFHHTSFQPSESNTHPSLLYPSSFHPTDTNTTSPSFRHTSFQPSEANTHLPSLYPSSLYPTGTNTTSPSFRHASLQPLELNTPPPSLNHSSLHHTDKNTTSEPNTNVSSLFAFSLQPSQLNTSSYASSKPTALNSFSLSLNSSLLQPTAINTSHYTSLQPTQLRKNSPSFNFSLVEPSELPLEVKDFLLLLPQNINSTTSSNLMNNLTFKLLHNVSQPSTMSLSNISNNTAFLTSFDIKTTPTNTTVISESPFSTPLNNTLVNTYLTSNLSEITLSNLSSFQPTKLNKTAISQSSYTKSSKLYSISEPSNVSQHLPVPSISNKSSEVTRPSPSESLSPFDLSYDYQSSEPSEVPSYEPSYESSYESSYDSRDELLLDISPDYQ